MFKFLSKSKKKFRAQCALSNTPLDKESSYLISTADVITSRKFWDNIMTEPDTLSYTEAYFKNGDATAKNIRGMIFKKYSGQEKAWVISDAHLHLFNVNESEAKSLADQWWDSEGSNVPETIECSLKNLGDQAFEEIRTYAIEEAGKAHVSI